VFALLAVEQPPTTIELLALEFTLAVNPIAIPLFACVTLEL
jgi:hypothetical protein